MARGSCLDAVGHHAGHVKVMYVSLCRHVSGHVADMSWSYESYLLVLSCSSPIPVMSYFCLCHVRYSTRSCLGQAVVMP